MPAGYLNTISCRKEQRGLPSDEKPLVILVDFSLGTQEYTKEMSIFFRHARNTNEMSISYLTLILFLSLIIKIITTTKTTTETTMAIMVDVLNGSSLTTLKLYISPREETICTR